MIADPTTIAGAKETIWTRPKLRKFKQAFSKAYLIWRNDNKKDTFLFEGQLYLVSFASYLIDHLTNKFGEK